MYFAFWHGIVKQLQLGIYIVRGFLTILIDNTSETLFICYKSKDGILPEKVETPAFIF